MKIELEGVSVGFLGYQCDACRANFLYLSGIVNHLEHLMGHWGCRDAQEAESEPSTKDGEATT